MVSGGSNQGNKKARTVAEQPLISSIRLSAGAILASISFRDNDEIQRLVMTLIMNNAGKVAHF
jgi:hypothetical protein